MGGGVTPARKKCHQLIVSTICKILLKVIIFVCFVVIFVIIINKINIIAIIIISTIYDHAKMSKSPIFTKILKCQPFAKNHPFWQGMASLITLCPMPRQALQSGSTNDLKDLPPQRRLLIAWHFYICLLNISHQIGATIFEADMFF